MKQKRFSDEQIIGILKEADAGAVVLDLCRKHGMSSAAYSVDPDQPFRPIVITCHGDRNHAVHHARGAHGGRLWVAQDRYH
jgi:hypothetical protein